VLREEARLRICLSWLPAAQEAIQTSMSLLKTAGERAYSAADVADRARTMALLLTWLGEGDAVARSGAAVAIETTLRASGIAVAARGSDSTGVQTGMRPPLRPLEEFDPSLTSKPWHDMGADKVSSFSCCCCCPRCMVRCPPPADAAATQGKEDILAFVKHELRTQARQIEAEALSLAGEGELPQGFKRRLVRQRECLHEPRDAWSQVTSRSAAAAPVAARAGALCSMLLLSSVLTAGSQLEVFEDGALSKAARHAPVAARIAGSARAQAIGLVRLGYSEVAAGAHIRAHWGPSNARWKIHFCVLGTS